MLSILAACSTCILTVSTVKSSSEQKLRTGRKGEGAQKGGEEARGRGGRGGGGGEGGWGWGAVGSVTSPTVQGGRWEKFPFTIRFFKSCTKLPQILDYNPFSPCHCIQNLIAFIFSHFTERGRKGKFGTCREHGSDRMCFIVNETMVNCWKTIWFGIQRIVVGR